MVDITPGRARAPSVAFLVRAPGMFRCDWLRHRLSDRRSPGGSTAHVYQHFPAELIDAEEFKAPKAQKVGPRELKMAQDLITSMSTKWEPESYHDDYHEALEEMIEEKLKHRGPEKPVTQKRKAPSNVIDLVSVLQESINASKGKTKTAAAKKKTKAKAKTRSRKKAA
jgi:DNA end-binding protein Ku